MCGDASEFVTEESGVFRAPAARPEHTACCCQRADHFAQVGKPLKAGDGVEVICLWSLPSAFIV